MSQNNHVNHSITDAVARIKLSNGLTLLIKENHNSPVAALLVSVRTGYFNESDRLNGIAHVVEHMLFKGTPAHPGNDEIAAEIRKLGGVVNAATYYEETYYYVQVPSQNLAKAMELQADAFQNSLFDSGELAKEIEVIVQESLQKRDNPNAMLIESLYEMAFDNHRIRRWRMGLPDTLRAFRREDLCAFVTQNYRPENMTFTVVGDVNAIEVVQLAERIWGSMDKGILQKEESPAEPAHNEFRYQRITGSAQQRLFALILPVPQLTHPDGAALMILNSLLSDGRSARLFRSLEEDQKLANRSWASYESFQYMASFMLGAESKNDDPLDLQCALWAEIQKLQTNLVTAEELERIKIRIESRRLFAQEEALGVARTLCSYENLGDFRLSDILLARLHSVTAEDVQRVALRYFRLDGASLLEYWPESIVSPENRTPETLAAAMLGGNTTRHSTEDSKNNCISDNNSNAEISDEEILPGRNEAVLTRPEPAQLIALASGAKLAFRHRTDLPIVAVNILFRGGKYDENLSNSGITNLTMKSLLKGTTKYTAEEIANKIEGLGTSIGTAIGTDYFGLGMKLKRDVLSEGFALLGEVISEPAFRAEEVEREKQAIFAEIQRQKDNSFSLAVDLFTSACFGNHAYGLPALGSESVITALTPEDLRTWWLARTTPENMTVSVVGDITAEEAVQLLADSGCANWGDKSKGYQPWTSPAPLPPYADYSEKRIELPKKQTATVIGFPGAGIFHEDRYALDMLAEITSGMSGRFFRSVRGESALAYQVTSFHRSRLDAGTFIAYTSTSPENAERARELLLAECVLLGKVLVSDEELNSAKAAVVGEHALGMQSFGAQSGELAGAEIYGLPLDEAERYLKRMASLTAEELRDAASRYLNANTCWLGVVEGTV